MLASVFPADPRYKNISPERCDPSYVEFDFDPSANGRVDLKRNNTLAEYMQLVRWPYGDIDIFIHSLASDEEVNATLRRVP